MFHQNRVVLRLHIDVIHIFALAILKLELVVGGVMACVLHIGFASGEAQNVFKERGTLQFSLLALKFVSLLHR